MSKLTVTRIIRSYKVDGVSFSSSSHDVNQKNLDGDTPLHIAVLRSLYDEVLVLLEAGANPNAIGEMGYTPLHYADNQDIFKLLVKYGADETIKNEFDCT